MSQVLQRSPTKPQRATQFENAIQTNARCPKAAHKQPRHSTRKRPCSHLQTRTPKQMHTHTNTRKPFINEHQSRGHRIQTANCAMKAHSSPRCAQSNSFAVHKCFSSPPKSFPVAAPAKAYVMLALTQPRNPRTPENLLRLASA